MILNDFIGGADAQQSLNHSDNRCINLIPSLNDKGDIAAFYNAPGLTLEATNPASAVGSGIYTASNGRAFEVAGTTLYELINTGGVISTTSRGTVTSASIYRMSDNGIELMLVNGTDGWLFTFATNTLKKIKVIQKDFTVTIADPAVFTSTAHGLEAGDAIRLTTTTDDILSTSLLEALVPSTVATNKDVPKLIAVSPDNAFAYVARYHNAYTTSVSGPVSTLDDVILMYSRNTESKVLSPLTTASPTQTITHPTGIVLSSDGISLYLSARYYISATKTIGNYVLHYTVNTTTGVVAAATPFELACGSNPTGIAISPDDKFVYVVNSGGNTVSQYSRNLATGELTALTPATITVGTLPQKMVIGTNAAGTVSFAYVTNKTDNTITVHARDVTTGALTQTPAQTISCGGLSPTGIAISPETDNPHVYVINNASGKVAMFSRVAATGLLTALTPSTVNVGTNPQEITIPADGDSVYVSNGSDNTVSMFIRDNSTGLLSATSTTTISTGDSPLGITTAPDGNGVYVANSGAATVSMFSRKGAADNIGLPEGLELLTTYYVISTGLTANDFEVSTQETWDNHFVNPNAPATQTSPSLEVGKYVLSMTGTGSIAVSAGTASITGAGTATSTTSVTFEVVNSGTVVYTVTGTPTTASAVGNIVATSGQQAGIHTFTTLGYGFPEGAKTIGYMNGRFICCEPNTQNFFVSEVLNGRWWDALNVQTVDANPDNVVGEVVAHQEVIVFCENSGQVYYDSGSYPTPFVPNPSGIFETGCVSPYSIVSLDNTVYWLGGNKQGQGIIYKLNGFTPLRISTHSIETAIQDMSVISDARAFAYQQNGHHFYAITFPTGDKTYVYDVNTGLWHERANFAGGSFSRWAAQEYAYFANKHLVLDYADGKIFSIDDGAYTYGTEDRKWLRSFRVPTSNMNRERHTRLQLDCEAGVGVVGGAEPTVMLKWSDDGGHTWSNEVWRSMGIGSVGEYNKRVVWHRLGMTTGQPRIYELSGTASVKTVLLNVYLD